MTKLERLEAANGLLRTIASCGRGFFRHGDDVGYFELDEKGRVWYVDSYTQIPIYTHYAGRWKAFSQGGTMRSLVIGLRDFIRSGDQLHPETLGPWPDYICGGDLWGYGDDMERVRERALQEGIIA